jgi:hypothetical protein
MPDLFVSRRAAGESLLSKFCIRKDNSHEIVEIMRDAPGQHTRLSSF